MAAAEAHIKLGDRQEAKGCAKLALQLEEDCIGKDNPLYLESVKRMRPIIG